MIREIELPYGRSFLKFAYDEARFSILTQLSNHDAPLSDLDIGAAFDSPIGSPPLDEIAGSDDSVLIVVSDATRATASAHVVNLGSTPRSSRRFTCEYRDNFRNGHSSAGKRERKE